MSLFLDRFHKLCQDNGVSPSFVTAKCGLSKQTYSHWKQRDSMPRPIALKKIADYFGVSVDYFVNEDNKVNNTEESLHLFTISEKLTEREYCILQLYRTLSDADKSDITERLFRLHEKDTQ